MKDTYCKAMDAVYWLCIWIAGLAMVVMTLVIPVQVVARKWFDSGLSWPEPMALMCMIIFTFVGSAAAYRAGSHIAVTMLTDRLPPQGKYIFARIVDLLMALVALFVIVYGTDRVLFFMETGQTLADFTQIQVSWTYLPLPIGSAATLLFIIESFFFGSQQHRPIVMIGSHGGSAEDSTN
ncbi:TRAP transporter small permease [Uliginosibacterium sp. TH139]|uniref:TRAP transporter small permease n=1 Tax=Uliginosibacterium sp. TH139 TaxID=2067453 RepID=UPI00157030E1|nr:TRAP transporter small permease [Uliginosibacterium sp. TH139]